MPGANRNGPMENQRAWLLLAFPILLMTVFGLWITEGWTSSRSQHHQIGYYGDLSGPTFNFGQSARNGVLMAADEINLAGGINGRPSRCRSSKTIKAVPDSGSQSRQANRRGQGDRRDRGRYLGQQPRRCAESAGLQESR